MATDPDRKVVVRHFERDPVNGPGMMVTRPLNLLGNPFVVFCSNKECETFIDNPYAIPFWSEDCKEDLGVLRCPNCQSPVLKPKKE